MKITAFAAALTALTLAAAPAFAGEGNGNPFPLRTPAIASATVAAAWPDTGAESTPDLSLAFTESADRTLFASGASEAPVQTANSLPAGALDTGTAYARFVPSALAAR